MEDDIENKKQFHKIEHRELSQTNEVRSGSHTKSGVHPQTSGCFGSKESKQRRKSMRSEFTMKWINQLEEVHQANDYSVSNSESGVYPQTSGYYRSKQNQAKHDLKTDPIPVLDCWKEVLAEAGTYKKKDAETVMTWTNQLKVRRVHKDYSGSSSESAVYPQTSGCFRSKQSQEKHGPGIIEPCPVLDCWREVLAEPGPSKRKDQKTVMTWTNKLKVHRRYKRRKYTQSSGFFQSNHGCRIADPYPLLGCWLKILADIRASRRKGPETLMTCTNQLELQQRNKYYSGSDIESSVYSQASICEKNPEVSEKNSIGDLCSSKSENKSENMAVICDEIIETGQDMMPTLSILKENEKQGLDKSRSRRRITDKDNHHYLRNQNREEATRSSKNDEVIEIGQKMKPLSIMSKNKKQGSDDLRSRRKIAAEDIRSYFDEDIRNYLRNRIKKEANIDSQKKTDDGWFTALRKRLSKFMSFTSND